MTRRRKPERHGLIVLDKPAGMTSHDAVARIRRELNERRVGHSGTLDPDATGVLVVGVGYATRLMRYLTGLDKRYTAEVVLGSATDTLDDSGTVVAEADMSGVTLADVVRAAAGLTGEIAQVPPMVSAIRVGGKRLHELAREGVEVEREARPVVVHRFEVSATDDPGVFAIDVTVSSGTYVRSLAADLGVALGGYAHLRRLRRHTVGPFGLNEACTFDSLRVRPVADAVPGATRVSVDAATAVRVRNGSALDAWLGDSPWLVADESGALVAVYERDDSDATRARPVVVFAEPVA